MNQLVSQSVNTEKESVDQSVNFSFTLSHSDRQTKHKDRQKVRQASSAKGGGGGEPFSQSGALEAGIGEQT